MEESLQDQDGYDKDTMARNRIRRCLRSFFQHRRCVTLVRPVESEADLQRLDEVGEAGLRPQFREQVKSLQDRLVLGAQPKLMAGKPVNGRMLCALARSYVTAINDGSVPNVADAWESAAGAQSEKAGKEAVGLYKATLQQALLKVAAGHISQVESMGEVTPDADVDVPDLRLPANLDQLSFCHAYAEKQASQAFQAGVPAGAVTARDKAEAHFRTQVAEFYAEVLQANEIASAEQCRALIKSLRRQHVSTASEIVRQQMDQAGDKAEQAIIAQQQKGQGGAPGKGLELVRIAAPAIEALWKSWEALAAEYGNTAVGPASHPVLATTGVQAMRDETVVAARTADDSWQKVLRGSEEVMGRFISARVALETEMAELKHKLKAESDRTAQLTSSVAQREQEARTASTRLQETLESLKETKNTLEIEREQVATVRRDLASSKQEKEDLTRRLEDHQSRQEKLKKDMKAAEAKRKEVNAQLEEAEIKTRTAEAELQSTKTKLQAVQEEAKAAKTELEGTAASKTTVEERAAALEAELAASKAEHADTAAKLKETEDAMAEAKTQLQELTAAKEAVVRALQW